jgi:hypothetical protein
VSNASEKNPAVSSRSNKLTMAIVSKVPTQAFLDNYDAIFHKKAPTQEHELKYSPVAPAGFLLQSTIHITAKEYRARNPDNRWKNNPWTGVARSRYEINDDPFGFKLTSV